MIQMGLIGTLEVFVRKPARDPSFSQVELSGAQSKEWQSSSVCVAQLRGGARGGGRVQVYDSLMSYDMHPLLGLYK